jgi:hypothetical protein
VAQVGDRDGDQLHGLPEQSVGGIHRLKQRVPVGAVVRAPDPCV